MLFGLGYEEQCCRKAKNDQSSQGVNTAVSDFFSNAKNVKKLEEGQVFWIWL